MSWAGVVLASAARRSLVDRAGLTVTVGFYLVVVAAVTALWRAAAGGDGTIGGYGAAAITFYLVASEATMVPLTTRMIEDIGTDIAGGAITVELLRPAPVLGVRVATELGRALPRFVACAAAGLLFGVAVTRTAPALGPALLAVPAALLALLCNITAQHAFAAAAFWVRDAGATWFLYTKLVFILGGMLIPVDVFPPWLQTVSWALPFVAMAYVPGRLLAGFFEPHLLAVQLGWLVVLALLARVAFAAGERRLEVVGG